MTPLLKGDLLLYKPTSLFGRIIQIKTWHSVSHCEVYAGEGRSWASRDGIGVNLFPQRLSELTYLLRPSAHLDLASSEAWAASMIGTPYGWLELLNFVGLPIQRRGIFCSQFVVDFYRKGGWHLFPEDRASQVAPFEFLNLVDAGFSLLPLDL